MRFAVPFLGFVAAIQGTCPNIASTALVGASKSLDMTGSTQALAASVQTLAVAASVITTGFLADRFVFASAYPLVPLRAYAEWFVTLPLKPDVLQKCAYDNAASLLGVRP